MEFLFQLTIASLGAAIHFSPHSLERSPKLPASSPTKEVIIDDETGEGQTLRSAYYLIEDVQYFPAGPEFILESEVIQQDLVPSAKPNQP